MRILAVGNMYPPHHFGGYELVWRSAMEAARAEGHDVRVLTTDLDTGATEPDDPGVFRELRWSWHDHDFPALGVRGRVALERHNARVLDRHLRELEPDVVSWWSMGGMSLSMMERVRRRGIPAVAFVHNEWLDYGRKVDGWSYPFATRFRALAPLAERLAGVPARIDLNRAARYVFVSEATRRRTLVLDGIDLESSGVAHSGIDPAFIDPQPEQEWRWRLLYVGRLDEHKGVHTAIEALAHLPPEAVLTIVGGWDEAEQWRLTELARRLGVSERVNFDGQRSRDELPAAYRDCDAVVFPSIWDEPWGLVPLEAMGQGRPVVATGRGGSGEYLLDGENALLFEAGDARALAAAVERLARDPTLRARLREAGLATAPRYTESHFNRAVLDELRHAVGT
jgi:glycosyltransferase involved in cell wall biosynthesis